MDEDDDVILYNETSKSNFHTSLIDDEDTIVMGGKKLSKYLPPKKIQEKKVAFLLHNQKIFNL